MHAEERFRAIFRKLHEQHPNCLHDEWLSTPCTFANGQLAPRPIVWSRRNGPWQRSDVFFTGAAPGNAGGKGAGIMGAHGTRIPFGGDIAGANLDVLLASIGLNRNQTFIAASYNQLPAAGGGEPTIAELTAPVGGYESSVHSVRDTIIAVGPRLLVALGNIALRVSLGAARLASDKRIPSLAHLGRIGLQRNVWQPWPEALLPDDDFLTAWRAAWHEPLPSVLWLTHPSAQNMSPFARTETLFHTRMLEARAALQTAARAALGWTVPEQRAAPPDTGIYDLPEWRKLIGPRHAELARLWAEKGV